MESEFELRRAHWEGKGGITCCLNIPKSFVEKMGIDRRTYLKLAYLEQENTILVQKLNQGVNDKP